MTCASPLLPSPQTALLSINIFILSTPVNCAHPHQAQKLCHITPRHVLHGVSTHYGSKCLQNSRHLRSDLPGFLCRGLETNQPPHYLAPFMEDRQPKTVMFLVRNGEQAGNTDTAPALHLAGSKNRHAFSPTFSDQRGSKVVHVTNRLPRNLSNDVSAAADTPPAAVQRRPCVSAGSPVLSVVGSGRHAFCPVVEYP